MGRSSRKDYEIEIEAGMYVDKLTNFFKILSDETRLRILVLLYHRKLCVCQICGITGIPQPNVSKHLAKLRHMGLVKDEKKEQYSYYSLDIHNSLLNDIIEDIIDHIEDYPVLKLDVEKSKAAEKYIELLKTKR